MAKENLFNVNMDILDKLQEESGFVRLILASGEIIYGKPLIITWGGEDDTIKEIMFEPYENENTYFYRLDDIQAYEVVEKIDIPHYE